MDSSASNGAISGKHHNNIKQIPQQKIARHDLLFGIFKDKKSIKDRIRKRKGRLSEFPSMVGDPAVIVDREFNYLKANNAFLSHFNINPEEIRHLNHLDIYESSDQDRIKESLAQNTAQGIFIDRVGTIDSRSRFWKFYLVPIYGTEKQRASYAIILNEIPDYKAKRHESSFLNSLIGSIDECVCFFGRDFKVMEYNHSMLYFLTQLNANPNEKSIKKMLRKSPDVCRTWQSGLSKVLATGESYSITEKVSLDDLEQWYELRFFPIKDTGDSIPALGLYMRNITERKSLGRELEKQKADLENAMELITKKSIALREVLIELEEHKHNVRLQIQKKVNSLVMPLMKSLKANLDQPWQDRIEFVEKCLVELSEPFSRFIEDKYKNLTSREIQVCDLIKKGFSSKEIAGALHISVNTVNNIRQRIRKKMGLDSKKVNLSTHLKSI